MTLTAPVKPASFTPLRVLVTAVSCPLEVRVNDVLMRPFETASSRLPAIGKLATDGRSRLPALLRK